MRWTIEAICKARAGGLSGNGANRREGSAVAVVDASDGDDDDDEENEREIDAENLHVSPLHPVPALH